MLTTSQKSHILTKAGVMVPPFPARRLPVQERHLLRGERAPQEERDADAEQSVAVEHWRKLVESLYVEYSAARAAKSLRESAEAERLRELRDANSYSIPAPQRHQNRPEFKGRS
jgi:hypothetical protein